MRTLPLLLALLIVLPGTAWAQHEHHDTPKSTQAGLGFSAEEIQNDPQGILMNRMGQQGSGTTLQPLSTSMGMWSWEHSGWHWMLHGNALLSLNAATGLRGYASPSLANWWMVMGSRVMGPGIADLRFMGSLEPATTPSGGTPQLFQTGETFGGRPLIDRQHPHDLFMEISGRFSIPWQDTTLFLYGGPVGEPALGPNAYMHRDSAADNALAPLAHHIQDSTHISMGVLTGGIQWKNWQAEGSVFRGREPDENRWNLDLGPLDSFSGRISFVPSDNWVMQVSSGFLHNPEPGEDTDLIRTTASIHFNHLLQGKSLATSLIWGHNAPLAASELPQTGWLLESAWRATHRDTLYGRLELVDKLGLLANVPGQETTVPSARVFALTLGGIHDFSSLTFGLGGDVTLYSNPPELTPFYGENLLAARIFLRLRPPLESHAASMQK